MRTLSIFINENKVGLLEDEDDIWSFTYEPSWLELQDGNYPLCPEIPLSLIKQTDGSSKRYIQWFFDNLLPEEGARVLLAKDLTVDGADSFGILSKVGSESAGAITLLVDGGAFIEGSYSPVTFDDLNSRILKLPKSPLNNKENKRMSIAGAQHKMLIIKDGDALYEPIGITPSSHILKPEHSEPEDFWQTVRNEWFVMKLAGAVGIDVPEVEVCYFPAPAYIIKRFDRRGEFPGQKRIHAMDGCQTLGISRTAKYGLSNTEYLSLFIDKLSAKGAAKIAIFNWAIFNALIGNTDAHLKNLSCLVVPEGLYLSPMYDLVSTAIYDDLGAHQRAELSQVMGNAATLGELTRDDVLLFGGEIGLPAPISSRLLNKMLSVIEKKADELIAYVEGLGGITNRAGELRMLLEIRHKMIGEMVKRLV